MVALGEHPRDHVAPGDRADVVVHLQRGVRRVRRRPLGIHAVLQARDQAGAPARVAKARVDVVEPRGRALREEHAARANRLARAGLRVGVLHDDAVALARQPAKQRAGADLRAFGARELADRAVELFARRRVRGSDAERVRLVRGRQRDRAGIEVHDRARQVELLAEARRQPGRAHALAYVLFTVDSVMVAGSRCTIERGTSNSSQKPGRSPAAHTRFAPTTGSRSSTTVATPRRAASRAAVPPAGPQPTTRNSVDSMPGATFAAGPAMPVRGKGHQPYLAKAGPFEAPAGRALSLCFV